MLSTEMSDASESCEVERRLCALFPVPFPFPFPEEEAAKRGAGGLRRPSPPSSSSHTRTTSHSHSSGSRSKGSSPTKGAGDPLFKRLVANLTPKIEWGDGRAGGRGGVRRDSSRRRSASR